MLVYPFLAAVIVQILLIPVVALALLVLVYLLSKIGKRKYGRELLEDAAEWAAPQLGVQRAELLKALQEFVTHKTPSPLLENIVRIEWHARQVAATRAERTVLVIVRNGDTLKRGQIKCEVPWEDLPSDVRGEFISHPEKEQSFLLLEKPGIEVPPEKETV